MIISIYGSSTFAKEPKVEQFNNSFFGKLRLGIDDEFDSNSFRLQASFFDLISSFNLFKFKIGNEPDEGESDYRSTLKAQVQRRVFDNRDLAETYTVVDIMKFPLTVPISIGAPIPLGQATFSYQLGLNLNFSFLNIRQSRHENLNKLTSLDDMQAAANQAEQVTQEIAKDVEEIENQEGEKGDKKKRRLFSLIKNTPVNEARYAKLFNLLVHPLRLPWNKKSALKLPEGEIFSYGVDGSIQLGGSVGWSALNIIGADEANAGVSVTTYLNGQFKISILKEPGNKILLKITRVKSKGVSANLGSASAKYTILKGFVVAGIKIGDVTESIFPLSLNIGSQHEDIFDVGYRYDLDNERAVEAYKSAVLGMLKLSDDQYLANDGVEKVFTRQKSKKGNTREYKMKFSIAFERGHQTKQEYSKLKVTIGKDVNYVFESVNYNSKGFETLWNVYEQKDYSFKTIIGEDFFLNDNPEIALSLEGTISDSTTSPKEIYQYIDEVEKAVGARIFPDVTANGPHLKCRRLDNIKCNLNRAVLKYGKSSFFYNINFSKSQLKKFIHMPEEKMWEILAKAHLPEAKTSKWSTPYKRSNYQARNMLFMAANLPLSLFDIVLKSGNRLVSAQRFHHIWKSLKDINDPYKLTKKLSLLFRSVSFNFEAIKILKEVIAEIPYSFYVSANSSKTFGAFQQSFNYSKSTDQLRTYIDRVIEFDNIRQRLTFDPEAQIASFNFKQDSADQITLTFDFKKKPSFVFFQIKQGSAWKQSKTLYQKVLTNDNVFQKGVNKIIVKRSDTQGLAGKLSKALFINKHIRFQAAIALQKDHWGEVVQTRFKVRENH